MFEKFKNSTLKNYVLIPSLYLSAPALIWDAMHSMKKVELELISDADIYLFFEKGMRYAVLIFLRSLVKLTISI